MESACSVSSATRSGPGLGSLRRRTGRSRRCRSDTTPSRRGTGRSTTPANGRPDRQTVRMMDHRPNVLESMPELAVHHSVATMGARARGGRAAHRRADAGWPTCRPRRPARARTTAPSTAVSTGSCPAATSRTTSDQSMSDHTSSGTIADRQRSRRPRRPRRATVEPVGQHGEAGERPATRRDSAGRDSSRAADRDCAGVRARSGRASRRRPPPLRIRSVISAGVRRCDRVAASSIASGRPSTARHNPTTSLRSTSPSEAAALDEQPNGIGLDAIGTQRIEPVQLLADQTERDYGSWRARPARGQRLEQFADEPADRLDQMLAVVEHQQRRSLGEVGHDVGDRMLPGTDGAPTAPAIAIGTTSPSESGARSTNHTPSGQLLDDLQAHLDRQPRLARAARPEDRDERARPRQRGELRLLGDTVDHRRDGPDQIVAVGGSDARRPAVAVEIYGRQAIQRNRLVEVAHTVPPECRSPRGPVACRRTVPSPPSWRRSARRSPH